MRTTSFEISESDYRRVNLATAALRLSAGEFYREVIALALDDLAQADRRMRIAFELSNNDDARMVLAGRIAEAKVSR